MYSEGTQHNLILVSPLSPGRCAKPIKNRDVVSLRSWQVKGDEYMVINFSVKHPVRRLLRPFETSRLYDYFSYHCFDPLQKYPPCTGFVRAISILTGYFIKPTGPNSCTFIYLSQADPKGTTKITVLILNLDFLPFLEL